MAEVHLCHKFGLDCARCQGPAQPAQVPLIKGTRNRFRMNEFRLRRLPLNGLKTKQCEQDIYTTV